MIGIFYQSIELFNKGGKREGMIIKKLLKKNLKELFSCGSWGIRTPGTVTRTSV